VAVAGAPTSLAICSHQLCCHGIAPPKTRTSKRIYLIVLSTAAVTVVFVWFLPPLLFLLLPLPHAFPLRHLTNCLAHPLNNQTTAPPRHRVPFRPCCPVLLPLPLRHGAHFRSFSCGAFPSVRQCDCLCASPFAPFFPRSLIFSSVLPPIPFRIVIVVFVAGTGHEIRLQPAPAPPAPPPPPPRLPVSGCHCCLRLTCLLYL